MKSSLVVELSHNEIVSALTDYAKRQAVGENGRLVGGSSVKFDLDTPPNGAGQVTASVHFTWGTKAIERG